MEDTLNIPLVKVVFVVIARKGTDERINGVMFLYN